MGRETRHQAAASNLVVMAETITDAIVFTGRMSTFGGPQDSGVGINEGLDLINPSQADRFLGLFLPADPAHPVGLARRLNPDAHYVACRWDFSKTPKEALLKTKVAVSNPKTGQSFDAVPVDWGPDPATGRVADLSDGLARDLKLETDDICSVTVPTSALAVISTSDDPATQNPIGAWQVLADEAGEIDGTPISAHTGEFIALHRELNKRSHAALCLSGGGIRSGSFALGLMQSLAGNPSPGIRSYLGQFHFLSTVSGGGYIGGWFSAWLTRLRNTRRKPIADDVLKMLADQTALNSEASAIENLRVNSNYLTPKTGAMSADSWADLAMYLRNLILNWFVIVPVFVFLVLGAKALTLFPAMLIRIAFDGWGMGVLAAIALVLTLTFLSYQIGGRPTQGISNRDQHLFLRYDLLPAATGSMLLCYIFIRPNLSADLLSIIPLSSDWSTPATAYAAGTVAGAAIYCMSWIIASAWKTHSVSIDKGLGRVSDPKERNYQDMFSWIIAGVLVGLFVVYGLRLLDQVSAGDDFRRVLIIDIVGPPWILLSHLVAEMIFVGLTSHEKASDDDREWLARSAGWYGIVVVGWTLFFGLLFIGTFLSADFSKALKWGLGPVGGISGAISHTRQTAVDRSKAEYQEVR
jgi:hypothetical protein